MDSQQPIERQRLEDAREGKQPWRTWGPYLSERQWGTVREDYSPDGDAWDYFPHDMARSRAYRWGEDGIGGVCDERQRLCLAPVLWNGRDPILKERLFGLTNPQGNHGEDVKELYYYLDATPTGSYLKMLYKYPQREFPYGQLLDENRRRGRDAPEFELLDTGIFDDDRYFDVQVEFAKAGPLHQLMLVTIFNRGPEAAEIHLLPQLWFRNTWSWKVGAKRPKLLQVAPGVIEVRHRILGKYRLHADGAPELLFCDNDTNVKRLFPKAFPHPEGFFKDAFHDYLIHGDKLAVNPQLSGTKAAAHYRFTVPAGGKVEARLALAPDDVTDPLANFDGLFTQRRGEADEFYAELQCDMDDSDARSVQRQAFAGMIWCKQTYNYDVTLWLDGDSAQPPPAPERKKGRNADWRHLNNADVMSMPDSWEYPWYASWDLAFHCIPLAMIDPDFAKAQLLALTREWFMDPRGQLPAYEWSFGDVNPPVHAWAAWRVYKIEAKYRGGGGDREFLERIFHKLMINFTWWVNRKDVDGRNIFQGGFLGLDNIGVFDRSKPLPMGGHLDQADSTSWMAMYSLNLLRIALELALYDRVYEDVATKFFEHFMGIAHAMTNMGGDGEAVGLWDEQDGFFYDVLHGADGHAQPMRVRSIVGLIPLFAVETIEPEMLERLPDFSSRMQWYLTNRPEMANLVSHWDVPGKGSRRLLSLLRGHRMKRLLKRALDETEFLSEHGVRSLSKVYKQNPYIFKCDGSDLMVNYEPGESETSMFGGNSNWRGPIWFPINFLIIESLQKFHHYYGDDFKIECPTGSGRYMTINDVAHELTLRMTRLFLRDEQGNRPIYGKSEKQQQDPHFRDHVHFFEYFHGDNGLGLGASHQTGWTGLIAKLIQPRKEDLHFDHHEPDAFHSQAAAEKAQGGKQTGPAPAAT